MRGHGPVTSRPQLQWGGLIGTMLATTEQCDTANGFNKYHICKQSGDFRPGSLMISRIASLQLRSTALRSGLCTHHAGRIIPHAGKSFASQAGEQHQVALVQGASRGLGLEYVRQLLSRPGQRSAACHSPEYPGAAMSQHGLTKQTTDQWYAGW